MNLSERMWMHSDVEVIVRDAEGNIKSRSLQKNLRTNGGADFWHNQLFGTPGAVAGYIGLTTDNTAPAATDTTLASEETTNGLGRALVTPSHTTATAATTLSHTWTYTGSSSKTITKVGLFNAASTGTMVLETLLTNPANVSVNGDQITVNWTVNF